MESCLKRKIKKQIHIKYQDTMQTINNRTEYHPLQNNKD